MPGNWQNVDIHIVLVLDCRQTQHRCIPLSVHERKNGRLVFQFFFISIAWEAHRIEESLTLLGTG